MEYSFDSGKPPIKKQDYSFDVASLPFSGEIDYDIKFFEQDIDFAPEIFEKTNQSTEYETDSLGNILNIDIDECNKITENDPLPVVKAKLEIQRQIAANSSSVSEIKTVKDVKPTQEKQTNGLIDPDYNIDAGKKLADEASKVTNTVSGGHCLAGVADILDAVYYPDTVPGVMSAYQMKDILNLDYGIGAHFKEVSVNRNDLINLPAGSVVVWDNNINGGGSNVSPSGKIHGHISIADGNGYEVSDFRGLQIDNRDANFSVFIPIS